MNEDLINKIWGKEQKLSCKKINIHKLNRKFNNSIKISVLKNNKEMFIFNSINKCARSINVSACTIIRYINNYKYFIDKNNNIWNFIKL